MRSLSTRIVLPLALTACFLGVARQPGAASVPAAEYDVRVIEEPEGRIFRSPSRIEGLNDRGEAVLWAQLQNLRQAALLWKDGKLQDLGTLGGKQAWPHAINQRGQVAGESQLADGTMHAFVWEDGKMRDLGTEPGLESRAWDLNERGVAVGSVQHPKTKESHAVRWSGGKLERLKDLGKSSSALYVNERGDIAGYGQSAQGGYWRGFFWKGAELQDLGAFPGWETIFLTGLNGRGEAVGTVSRGVGVHSPGEYLAIRTSGAELREIPVLAAKKIRPKAINDEGWILGFAPGENVNEQTAYLLRDGRLAPLDDLIRGSGWRITGVAALNNRGQIGAYGKRGEEVRGLILSPKLKLTRHFGPIPNSAVAW